MNAKQIWQTAIERLRTRVNSAVFTTWFQGTSALSFQDSVFIIRVPTTFAKAQLETRFQELIRSTLIDVTGGPVEVRFEVTKEQPSASDASSDQGSYRPAKRTYRLSKGRLSAPLRGKRVPPADGATTMNAMAPSTPPENAYRQKKEDYGIPQRSATSYNPEPASEPPTALSYVSYPEGQDIPAESIRKEPIKTQEYSPVHPSIEGLLNPRYTFSSFIVGKSNKLAHATSLAVAENPGRVYNPLFLYGGVGLGKTHLLHGIGHAGESAGLNVLYTTSEKFTNEIINAIRFQKTEEFRAKYRQIDILLVDDIQFIAGKESTEEEFFHTFNSLHNANKQIVVTSDRPPKAISSLQDRLRSRFEWGLLADVQPPEYEHRLAILRSKCDSLRFTVPANVIEYIARPVCSSVRELEGALNRVIAYATLHDAPLTVSLAAQALEHIYDTKPPVTSNLTVEEVFDGVCRYYNVNPQLVRGKQRDRDIVWPRQVAMYLMREETTASLLQIGSALGGRDHSTIMHGWEKVHAEIGNNEQVRQEIAAVLDSLQNRSF
ncbi:chromosomal replication initiator protein DnaA [Dictyobacter alpinus]|uniref:Chromosomal replication initiator protein DnaA n=1 Tax=Dictyobacter alpinus TaxID=2014873 RepID=A0A402B7A9_9CHLR|nr:chromosomal replication initiator protein DnaA [Dictyobacter alpinus]GCE27209.1 chromosomal replication initiator protein DnaA [Dictyobacter alpinus]